MAWHMARYKRTQEEAEEKGSRKENAYGVAMTYIHRKVLQALGRS